MTAEPTARKASELDDQLRRHGQHQAVLVLGGVDMAGAEGRREAGQDEGDEKARSPKTGTDWRDRAGLDGVQQGGERGRDRLELQRDIGHAADHRGEADQRRHPLALAVARGHEIRDRGDVLRLGEPHDAADAGGSRAPITNAGRYRSPGSRGPSGRPGRPSRRRSRRCRRPPARAPRWWGAPGPSPSAVRPCRHNGRRRTACTDTPARSERPTSPPTSTRPPLSRGSLAAFASRRKYSPVLRFAGQTSREVETSASRLCFFRQLSSLRSKAGRLGVAPAGGVPCSRSSKHSPCAATSSIWRSASIIGAAFGKIVEFARQRHHHADHRRDHGRARFLQHLHPALRHGAARAGLRGRQEGRRGDRLSATSSHGRLLRSSSPGCCSSSSRRSTSSSARRPPSPPCRPRPPRKRCSSPRSATSWPPRPDADRIGPAATLMAPMTIFEKTAAGAAWQKSRFIPVMRAARNLDDRTLRAPTTSGRPTRPSPSWTPGRPLRRRAARRRAARGGRRAGERHRRGVQLRPRRGRGSSRSGRGRATCRRRASSSTRRPASLAAGETFYTYQRGIPELREAISRYMSRLYGQALPPERFFVTHRRHARAADGDPHRGGRGRRGADPVAGLAELPRRASAVGGATPVEVPMSSTRCATRLVARRRAPRGRRHAAHPRHHRQLAVQSDRLDGHARGAAASSSTLARRHGLWIIADEIYGRFVFDGARAGAVLPRHHGRGGPHPLRADLLEELGDDRLAARLAGVPPCAGPGRSRT